MVILDIFRTLVEVPTLLTLKKGMQPRPLDANDCFAAQVERTAARLPDRPAVIFEGRTVSWAELNSLANAYADVFKDRGLTPGATASVLMENRVEFLATIIALNKIGVTAGLINTNLRGAYLCTKFALRSMMEQSWGRIINVASLAGIVGNQGQANYSAAKGGLIAFTKSLAREVGSRNITANAIAPGFVTTPVLKEKLKDINQRNEDHIKWRCIKRIEVPEDLVGACVFLSSDDSDFITGQTIVVDGGVVMN